MLTIIQHYKALVSLHHLRVSKTLKFDTRLSAFDLSCKKMTPVWSITTLPPGGLASPLQGYPQHFIRLPWQFAGTFLYSWGERSTKSRVELFAQEHNTLTQPGLEPWPLDTVSSTPCVPLLIYMGILKSFLCKRLCTYTYYKSETLGMQYVAW